jgi:hypothetical protein
MNTQTQQRWSHGRILTARIVAVVADALQVGVIPLFAEGIASPLDAALDVLICGTMMLLLGWNWLFLPTFVAEGIPALDLCPTWTAAVFFVTRKSRRALPAVPVVPQPQPKGGQLQGSDD